LRLHANISKFLMPGDVTHHVPLLTHYYHRTPNIYFIVRPEQFRFIELVYRKTFENDITPDI
jgi:hypothetical protein